MVFKPFTTLARQSISKHLVNGYAQSVVAATQSSYASSTLPIKFGQSNAPAKIQNAFGGAHSGRTAPGKDSSVTDTVNAFYAAHSAQEDKEEKKYLFSRKILWSKAQHQQQQKQLLGIQPEPIAEPIPPLSRSGSFASAAVEGLDAQAVDGKAVESAIEDDVIVEAEAAEVSKEESPQRSAESLEDILYSEPEPSPETREFNMRLQMLRDQGRWEEVTVLFRHMGELGIPPNTTTYNLLLDSIVSLRPRYVAQVIDVYLNMLRQKLSPTTSTYSILIHFLASRALRSLQIATHTSRDARRFGVMLPSTTQEVEELKKEGAMDYALNIFYDSTEVRTERVFPVLIYSVLIQACSRYKRDDDMLKVYSHMESHNVAPTPEIIGSMIRGFGRSGSIRSAVETYNCWLRMPTARDPSMMDQRYQVYRDLIKAYMDSGDAAGALSFLEKVVDISQERLRLEWLKQAVVEGFVSQGDIQSARQWASQLAIEYTPGEWLGELMNRVADQGELDFAQQIYNTIPTTTTITTTTTTTTTTTADLTSAYPMHTVKGKQVFAACQMNNLMACIETGQVNDVRTIWRELCDRERSTGPDITAALRYTEFLFEKGLRNEALVVLKMYSEFYSEEYVPSPTAVSIHSDAKSQLREGFDYIILALSNKGLLDPGTALDVVGFGVLYCGGVGFEASKRVLGLFDTPRILGLTVQQLHMLLLSLLYPVMCAAQRGGMPLDEYCLPFKTMFNQALKFGADISGPIAEVLDNGAAMISYINPALHQAWGQYVQQELCRMASPPATILSSAPMSASPTLVASEGETLAEDTYDPYWSTTDVKTSNAIDTALSRSRYNKIGDLRRMYRSTRRASKTLRLTTLAKIISAASRTPAHEDFMDEIIKNARIDCPKVLKFPSSRFGWCSLLDSMIAAQLTLGNREKAHEFHNEMLEMDASPSANTYGLYIVHLKGTHQTYDEASEAVTIFQRAISENVLPTSFLYNAVIGKLAKARRVDDCLAFFASMRISGIKPTSVTYGTMINALTRVGDETFAEELFKEMETMPNYRPRAAPYNSLIQFFVSTKRDRNKVLAYYNRMLSLGIAPTSHTYKLLIEAYATLEEPDMDAAERVLESIEAAGLPTESSHHAALIHAKGCALHDVAAAIKHFESVIQAGKVRPDGTLYQALLECLVANHRVAETPTWVKDMESRHIQMTPYIANTLIHGWTLEKDIEKARQVYQSLGSKAGQARREPSTYEAMTRAYLAVEDREGAKAVAEEMMGRGYPNAVVARVLDLVRMSEATTTINSATTPAAATVIA